MSEYIIDGSDRRSPKAARNAGIYEERKAGAKFIEIAGKYGLTVERIRQICRKEQWYRSRFDGLQPIVRCRDCRHYEGVLCTNGFIDGNPDAFCSWGERRDA